MLTPQEITDKVFIKAVFGGYDMTGVDDFLEAVCADYTSLYKENAILKGKLKVLVEKVEEYRSTEDAMRMALLTAQRMGEEITLDANKQKEETLRGAELEAKAKLAETARKIADEELKLNAAAKETAKFIELSQAIMRKHSDFLTKLETARRAVRPGSDSESDSDSGVSAVPAPDPVPPSPSREEQIADAAEIIGNVMERLTGSSAAPADVIADIADPEGYDDEGDPTKQYIPKDQEDSLTPRPKFDFDDLKFGSNFTIDE
ncbi:MAG: DivIVA domain-containing protein [Oscillospiraceae bacterium]|nr:DivIVA domain-containing protein [Oscillospiraceae bacterium]